jgi:hypothetical protein
LSDFCVVGGANSSATKGSFCIKSKGATKKTQEKMNDLKT